jgi:hypothetical protein
VTAFARPVDVVLRDPVPVMRASCPDDLRAIQELWPRFEELV